MHSCYSSYNTSFPANLAPRTSKAFAMPEFEGIHACLVVKKHALEEYNDPEYPFDPVYSHIRYV